MNTVDDLMREVYDRMNNRRRENIEFPAGWVAAAVIPAITVTLMYILSGIAPFGDRLLMCGQNSLWFESFRRFRSAMNGNGNIYYSFSGGFGGEIYSDLRSGFFTPLSLLTVLFPDMGLSECLVMMTIIRSMLAGLFSYLLFMQFSARNAMASLTISTGYASGTLFTLSFLAPQFADAPVFLPLTALGLALLSSRGSVMPLFFGCSFFLLTAPSLWPMLAIFSIVFFIWCNMIFQPENVGLHTGMLIFCAAISVGVDAAVLVPALVSDIEQGTVMYSAAAADRASVGTLLSSLAGGFVPETGICAPLIFCSSLPALLVPVYLTTRRISIAERQTSGFFMFFILLSMLIAPLGAIWLCFSAPTGTMIAFSSACAVICAAMSSRLCDLENSFRTGRMLVSWLFIFGVFSVPALLGYGGFSMNTWIFAASFLTLTAAVALAALAGRTQKLGLYLMLLFIVCFDCVVGGMISMLGTLNALPAYTVETLAAENADMQTMNNLINSNENGRDIPFRIRGAELDGQISLDAHSNSTLSSRQLVAAFGIKDGQGYTPVTDSLLGIRYMILDHNEECYKPLGMNHGQYLNYNAGALGLAYPADRTALNLSTYSIDPFVSQNLLMTAVAGADRELFTASEITLQRGVGCGITTTTTGIEIIRSDEKAYVEYHVRIPASGALYMYINEKNSACENVAVDGNQLGIMRLDCVNRLGTFERGSEAVIYISVTGERLAADGIWFATLTEPLTGAALAELAARPCITQINGNKLIVTAKVAQSQFVMTTVPWRSGWSVTVDGEKKEALCAAGCFLGAETGEGTHSVVFEYTPTDLTGARIISILSFIIGFLFIFMVENARRKNEEGELPPPPEPMPVPEYAGYPPYPDYGPQEYMPPYEPEPNSGVIPELIDGIPGDDIDL